MRIYALCAGCMSQVVPTSVDPKELCVNGMSFSKRSSKWANSALVVSITPDDMTSVGGEGPLRGVRWQQVSLLYTRPTQAFVNVIDTLRN